MSQRICNSKSEPYWWKQGWTPTHMTFAWLETELRVFSSSPPLNIPRRVRKFNARLRKIAKNSRKRTKRGW